MTKSFLLSSVAALALVGVLAGVTALPSPARQEPTAPPEPVGSPEPIESPEPVPPAGKPVSPARVKLREAFGLQRAGRDKEAATILKSLDPKTLDPDEEARRHRYAILAALRTGDRKWLDELNADDDHAKLAVDLLLLTAMRFLKSGDYDECRALLERVQSPQTLSEVPRRRYLELYARLEQLTGHPDRERIYVAKLVDFASGWESPVCQGCHGDYKKFGNKITTIDIKNRWFGERFGALLKAQGGTGVVRDAAQKRLTKNPKDTEARLRLVYLLQAEGKTVEADKLLAAFPWAEMPGREPRTPLQLAVFP
ncbi:MAG: hypothetical protein H7Y38_00765 [Armatimonadetes bacterium]|nr:hypothetical protein [Armatimonadota bacterium]